MSNPYKRDPLPYDLADRAATEEPFASAAGIPFTKKDPRDKTYPAYLRGRIDRMRGTQKSSCPYPDKRNGRGTVTFSRAFINAWFYGWEHEDRWIRFKEERNNADTTD